MKEVKFGMECALLHLYYMDKANAQMHCKPVKFSPVTFRLAEEVENFWQREEITLSGEGHDALSEIRSHVDQYELDHGR